MCSAVLAHGYLYTSLSCVQNRSTLQVLLGCDNDTAETDNVVCHELLLTAR
jgi:hypothetical protein